MNRGKIISYFLKAEDSNFEIRNFRYLIDNTDCYFCKNKLLEGRELCRQHLSINRVLSAKDVAYDIDTNTYLCKNEIFKVVNNEHRLVIVFCPHTKMITGDMTNDKARKLNPITIEDPNLVLPKHHYKISKFSSKDLISKYLKCWFNQDFSITTIPRDINGTDFYLTLNK
jgi:hypothetical protein